MSDTMPRPQGAYVPAVAEPLRAADVLITTAGMTPRKNGHLTTTGLVGRDLDLQSARQAAALSTHNALAAVTGAMTAKPAMSAAANGGTTAAAASDGTAGGVVTAANTLQRVRRWVRMTVYVACVDGFTELSAVADGASAVLDELTPDLGRPARSAIGVRALPGGAPVEVELTAIARPALALPSHLEARTGGLLAEAIGLLRTAAELDGRVADAFAEVAGKGGRRSQAGDSSVEGD